MVFFTGPKGVDRDLMPRPENRENRDRSLSVLLAVLVAALTFLAYRPALTNGFINWDDPIYVYWNPGIRTIDLGWAFTTVVAKNWHPLTMLSHAVDFSLWGLNPRGHHLTSVVLHAANTFLVFILVERLIRGKPLLLPLVASLLFALHPLHVESVAWVSERKDVLSGFFYLLSVIFYLGYARGSRPESRYGLALFFFVLALLSKPMAVSLPLVLLILDYYPLGRFGREGSRTILIEKIPFFVLSAAISVVTLWTQHQSGAVKPLGDFTVMERLVVSVRACVYYLYKMILPVNLAPLYPLPGELSPLGPLFIVSALIILVITAFAVVAARRGRGYFLSAWLFYLVALLPVIGIVHVGAQAAADRYTYLPSLGPFVLAGAGLSYLFDRSSRTRLVTLAFVVFMVGAFAVKTVEQEALWRDPVTLWSHEIRIFPGVPSAYYNRGHAYLGMKEYTRAIEDFTAAVELDPGHTSSYNARGVAYRETGDLERAEGDFTRAIELDPGSSKAYLNRGNLYLKTGEAERAAQDLKKAAELKGEGAGGEPF